MADNPSRSWFLVYNHPQEIVRYKINSLGEYILDVNNDRIIESSEPNGYAGLSPEELCEKMLDIWCLGSETRTAACSYCISAKGLHHLHLVVEDAEPFRFSKVKQAFPRAHIEATRGNKSQAENYINKRGVYAEKGEQVICIKYRGEIKGYQGKRTDLEEIEKMLSEGVHPNDIFLSSLKNEKLESIVKKHFYRLKVKDTPMLRDVNVYWHVGPSGCGKTHIIVDLDKKHGNDLFAVFDYDTGYLDDYLGESVLFLDEFRGQIRFSTLLTMLQGYRARFHARYQNIVGLWTEVHITSVYPPERLYKKLVDFSCQDIDTFEQLKRRITGIYYHWFDDDTEEFRSNYIEMEKYVSYGKLVIDSMGDVDKGFAKLTKEEEEFVQLYF